MEGEYKPPPNLHRDPLTFLWIASATISWQPHRDFFALFPLPSFYFRPSPTARSKSITEAVLTQIADHYSIIAGQYCTRCSYQSHGDHRGRIG